MDACYRIYYICMIFALATSSECVLQYLLIHWRHQASVYYNIYLYTGDIKRVCITIFTYTLATSSECVLQYLLILLYLHQVITNVFAMFLYDGFLSQFQLIYLRGSVNEITFATGHNQTWEIGRLTMKTRRYVGKR